jgi:hypothetical protein
MSTLLRRTAGRANIDCMFGVLSARNMHHSLADKTPVNAPVVVQPATARATAVA